MANPDLIKNYVAGGDIPAYRIVKFGADDNTVVLATAATDYIIGVSDLGGVTGDRLDIVMDDIAEVEFGGTIVRGGPVTTDAAGKAIAATVAGSRTIGFAMVSGVVGDIGTVNIIQSKI
ncbi:MAG: hypothetical protein M0P91_05255 [Sulfuricurvum sp.]|jgi:hypothetical protein|uniref:hypothetical protein n=1 Tax=Sulfuricurvum sp. TaxID=2025608 RepID=UPI0025D485A0|nr:hypothetical protein [Sulfuricurvum sp.]MCK9372583.1 hypothetical protein [Sulfuricurvum sp.]